MQHLDCPREEAESVYEYDKKVERDEATEFDLKGEQKKAAQAYCRTGTRKTSPTYNWKKPAERKPNATKGEVISQLAAFLKEHAEFETAELQVPNKEQKISWRIGKTWYTLTLTEHRTPPKWADGKNLI